MFVELQNKDQFMLLRTLYILFIYAVKTSANIL